jgi:hypothetical protein
METAWKLNDSLHGLQRRIKAGLARELAAVNSWTMLTFPATQHEFLPESLESVIKRLGQELSCSIW